MKIGQVAFILGSVALLSFGGRAQATLIGDQVSAFFEDPLGQIQNQQGPVVANGTQILAVQHTLITVTAGQVIYDFTAGWGFPSDPFSGIALYDYTHPFTSASLASSTFSLPTSNVSFDSGYIYLNMAGYNVAANGGTSAEVIVNADLTLTAPVPEPRAIGTFGIALIGLALGRRLRDNDAYRRA